MKRRDFINHVLLLSGGLVLSGRAAFGFGTPAKNKLKGTVRAAGKRLAHVAVSDGYSVVQTDRKGRFKLPVHAEATSVFVSIPAGYAIPHEKGIARHYHLITADREKYDFELTPLTQDDTNHTFIVWADPQVRTKGDVRQMVNQAVPDVQQLVQSLGAGTLVHGMTVGDIVWDKHELFTDYDKAVAGTGIPFFQALGNHDMDYNQGGDEASDDTFQRLYGPTYYSFNRGKVHYVVLDDVRYLGTDRNYDGHLTPAQLSWLKADLALVPKEHLIVIGLHIPVHNAVENNAELYAILAERKVHIMSGHTHYNRNVIKDNVYEHVHGTLCGAWWTGPMCGDGTPRGYGVYEVEGNELKWYFKSTGYGKEHQLRLHVVEDEGQKQLFANVWNWDPEWKVSWWADGKAMGELKNTVTYDPEAFALYKGKDKPETRGFAEPTETDHLFVTSLAEGMKTVRVEAIDRFGNKYDQTISTEIS
ncbi:calcineurin-like phosphoesterase C-terminal domain-containing protein [Pontibacter mangrovi]|uniref:Metallophosphoesterase n=1 Tax=Pontibacter mangrovi TaxID=2589816 RepID=A0A501W1C8_9BACT|nr:calcineurin-like phosphoesterase family protein [Pontibacter mangrovi]TPE41051.1 metallophosphoesterase [Pontibacter mangrovi]